MENTNENLFELLDEELLGKGLKKIRDFSAKDFAKFSAVTAVCFSITLWITRSLGYFYTLGRFSVYHIDKGYIDVWSEGFLIQVIQSISVCILLFTVNYVYFQLSIPKEGKKVKRRLKKIGFILLEFIVLSAWVLFTNNISFIGLLKQLPDTSMVEVLALLIVWCVVLMMVNVLGIEATFFYKASIKEKKAVDEEVKTQLEKDKDKKKKQRKQNKKEKSDTKYQRWIRVIVILLITCIIEFIFMYVMGVLAERQRNEFKFVVEKVETVEGDEFLFTSSENEASYYVYPIIYENQDVYILSQIGKSGEGVRINYDFLKVIDKENVSTYYANNLKLERNY